MTPRAIPLETADITFTQALADIAHVLASAEQPEGRIQRALELFQGVVSYEHAAVLIDLAPERRFFATVPASHPAAERLHARLDGLFESIGDRLTSQTGPEPYRVPDKVPLGSWSLAVPLVSVDTAIGILYVGRDTEEYTVQELRLMAIVASQFGGYARGLQFLAQAEHARTQAESASRAKDRFMATLSHELRTPLNVVQGWLQMLRAGPDTEAAMQKAISVIERNVSVQVRLVEQLLDAARIATGKFDMAIEALEILPIINASVDGVRPNATLKGIELEYAPSSADWMIDGDPARLQQAFANLLVNAVKFTPAGGLVRVSVGQDGGHLHVEFRDTGIGIAAEHLPKLFEPLWQGDGAPAHAEGGLGLGLSIVRHIVQFHGGEVWVESDGPDQGTAVTVRLPLNSQSTARRPSA